MIRNQLIATLAVSALLAVGASAQTVSPEHRPGRRPFVHRPHFGLGLGYGFGYRDPFPVRTVYRNAYTGDVGYAERAVNDFRAAYEKRGGDPLGVKSEIQRMDEDMERLRGEAENFGNVTIHGSELYREVLARAERIDRRFQGSEDVLSVRWQEIDRLLHDLAQRHGLG